MLNGTGTTWIDRDRRHGVVSTQINEEVSSSRRFDTDLLRARGLDHYRVRYRHTLVDLKRECLRAAVGHCHDPGSRWTCSRHPEIDHCVGRDGRCGETDASLSRHLVR